MSRTCSRAELSVSCDVDCLVAKDDRRWWYFLSTSAVVFFGGLFIIVASRLTIRVCKSKRARLNPSRKDTSRQRINHGSALAEVSERGIYVRLKEQAGTLITAQTFKGRCLVSNVFI